MASEARAGHWELKAPPPYNGSSSEADYEQEWGTYFSGNVATIGSRPDSPTYPDPPREYSQTAVLWKGTHGGTCYNNAGGMGGVASIKLDGKWRWKLIWKRDTLPNSSTPDPDDNPAKFAYVRFNATSTISSRDAPGDDTNRKPATESASASIVVIGELATLIGVAPTQNTGSNTSTKASRVLNRVLTIPSNGKEQFFTPWLEVKSQSALTGNRSYTAPPFYPYGPTGPSWPGRTYWKDGRCNLEGTSGASNVDVSYSLSVDAGPCGPGSVGCTGRYPGDTYWDGTYHFVLDSNTGYVQQVKTMKYQAPDEKHFTAVVTARVTLPNDMTPESSITVKARRVRRANGVLTPITGEEPKTIPLSMVTQDATSKPHPNTDGTTTYTYRTHDLEDNEAHRSPGSADQVIDDWKGRWQFYIEGFIKHGVELKIDKRSQLVNYGLDWVNFWPHRPKSSEKHTTVTLRDGSQVTGFNEASYIAANGQELFTQCHSYVGHVYSKMGLYAPYSSGVECNSIQGDASAIDDGLGAIRCFVAHSGLITGFGLLYGGEMSNINNPEEAEGGKGLKLHDWNFGGTLNAPPNRTMPVPGSAPDLNNNNNYPSYLKQLDGE